MAGNKMSVKTKGRDDKGKGNKSQPSELSEDFDLAQLRKPIKSSITGFAQARKIFDFATEEIKDLLSNECDLLYECKVCRNIFRSLVNFISHKRVYCKEKFNSSAHGHFIKNSSLVNELQRLKRMEESYQEAIKEKEDLDKEEEDERIPLTKDLSAIIERMTKTKGVLNRGKDVEKVSLQRIPNSSVAVFQSINMNEEEMTDNMGSQVRELEEMLSQDKAVLDSDGAFRIESSREPEDPRDPRGPEDAEDLEDSQDPDCVIQISDDDDVDGGDVLKCKICNLQFSTQKTLKFHIKYKHLESRLVYPCPDCVDIFSTSWSVYRHLFKVHRKSAAQIRRLRESIQSKAFRMNNPPASYERRKNHLRPALGKPVTEEERLDQENQAWMDNMESDGAAPRCGGCGRSFERRAALAAHTHTCQPRHRALAPPRRQPPTPAAAEPIRPDPVLPRRTTTDPRRIEIQIRKDYNKGPAKSVDSNGNKLPQDENAQSSFKTDKEPEKKVLEEATMFVVDNQASNDKDSLLSDSPEKSNDSVTSSSAQTPPKTVTKPTLEQEEAPEPKPSVESTASMNKPFMEQAERVGSNLTALKQKVYSSTEVDISKLYCKRCDSKHRNIQELCDHMATHYKWLRYACKLCNHKNYNFDNLSEHVKTVHKLKGDSDFYHSTVKAIDGAEALDLFAGEKYDEFNEANDTSPNSRRPSRCSSDSSRLSDDSNSSTARVETVGRKRRMGPGKGSAKRKKRIPEKGETVEVKKENEVTIDKVIHHVIFGDNENSNSNGKAFEENSSDLDDLDEKLAKRVAVADDVPQLVSRRPVRKRTRPKYSDYEYDLSNLLKMEAQGYRESQGVTATKTTQGKKKPTPEIPPQSTVSYDINQDFVCALLVMSKKSVELSAAHMRPMNMSVFNKPLLEQRVNQYPFAKPMLPKSQMKSDKTSPKKEVSEEKESPQKTTYSSDATKSPKKAVVTKSEAKQIPLNLPKEQPAEIKMIEKVVKITGDRRASTNEKPNSEYISAVVPVKFRRQSLDVIKPLLNQKINDLSKSGLKTKILVIKPINRKDGVQSLNSAMKFQTIKLKEPSNALESKPDQVMVVKVPQVDCAPANATNSKEPSSTESKERCPTDSDVKNETADLKTLESTENTNEISEESIDEPMEVVDRIELESGKDITDRIEPECEKEIDQEAIADKT